jgi:5'-AMP-activated protein kinase regulatory beta subunit
MGNAPPNASSTQSPSSQQQQGGYSSSSGSNRGPQQPMIPNIHNAPPHIQNAAYHHQHHHNPYVSSATTAQQQQQQQQYSYMSTGGGSTQQQQQHQQQQQQQLKFHYGQQQQQHRRSASDASMADVGMDSAVVSTGSTGAHQQQYHQYSSESALMGGAVGPSTTHPPGGSTMGSPMSSNSTASAAAANSATTATSSNSNNAITTSSRGGGFVMVEEEDTVPTVFRWEHGGRQVYITGTFNDWSRQIPMHRSGNDFTYIHNLRKGKHAFKFIVDDEWRFAPDQPTVADIEGRINNFIDVSDFKPYTGDRHFEDHLLDGTSAAASVACTATTPTSTAPGVSTTTTAAISHDTIRKDGITPANDGETTDDDILLTSPKGPSAISATGTTTTAKGEAAAGTVLVMDKEDELFKQTMPDLDEYTKEPPPLPPHLRHIILNKAPSLTDTAALPVPQHVALNHLYCTAIKDNMMVLGVTQRYKTKFVTTVYYSPCD